jgi:hypothetical protein
MGDEIVGIVIELAMSSPDPKLVARLVNGALVLEPIDVAIRGAQAMVRAYIPDNAGVVDELIAERHAAAEGE